MPLQSYDYDHTITTLYDYDNIRLYTIIFWLYTIMTIYNDDNIWLQLYTVTIIYDYCIFPFDEYEFYIIFCSFLSGERNEIIQIPTSLKYLWFAIKMKKYPYLV